MKKYIIIIFLLIPVLTLAQENPSKKKAYYFYGEQCSHCKNVDAYFQANGIYGKYEITKLEVVSDPTNAKKFLEFGKAFNEPDWGGVPAIVFGDKFLLGDKPIIENFVGQIDAAENANELPDPDKIGKPDNQGNQADQGNGGNKGNYFPVIIGALIVLAIGALMLVNRKR